MKKYAQHILILFLALLSLSSCSKKTDTTNDSNLKIVATIFPPYDWAREIIGNDREDVSLTLLLDKGVDLHSFQPTVQDIMTISSSDLFLYCGGESDGWVEDVLKEAKCRKAINLLEVLGDRRKVEELVEGMEEEEEEGAAYDEHIWLSLRNAEVLVNVIVDALTELDPAGKASYEANGSTYLEKLQALDTAFLKTVEEGSTHTLLFGDRFPFRYLVDDYGLNYYAAFAGCSAESEASFETIAFLSEKVKELDLPAICTLENSDRKIASVIRENASRPSLRMVTFDSMQSVTKEDVARGESYLGIMERNLEALSEALD